MEALTQVLGNIVPMRSFNEGKSSQNFEKAKKGPVVVMKNNAPEAVILNIDEYKRLRKIEEDYLRLQEDGS